jgi:hypothetical protein
MYVGGNSRARQRECGPLNLANVGCYGQKRNGNQAARGPLGVGVLDAGRPGKVGQSRSYRFSCVKRRSGMYPEGVGTVRGRIV